MHEFYIVEELTASGWANTWGDNAYFEFKQDAKAEILDHVNACIDAVNAGFMEDAPSLKDFRIVKGL